MALSTGGAGFQDQMAAVAAWFGSWSECEQTVALSALARKLPLSQARFMQHVLSQAVTTAAFDKPDFERLEARANDSGKDDRKLYYCREMLLCSVKCITWIHAS